LWYIFSDVENNVAKCEQCPSFKIRVQELQDKLNDAEKRLQSMDKLKDEHDKETIYRKEMEEKWNEKLEEHKNKVCIKNLLFIKMLDNKFYCRYKN